MLSDAKVRALKTPGKVTDREGLYVLVTAGGSRLWRFDYRYGGKRKTLALGRYPDVTLAGARERLLEARQTLARGQDPGAERRAQKAQEEATLGRVAESWIAAQGRLWTPRHRDVVAHRLKLHLGRLLDRPIAELRAPEVLVALQGMGSLYTAGRLRQDLERIFAFAVGSGLAEHNPARDIAGVLAPPDPVRHRSAITDPGEFKALLRALGGYGGDPITRACLRLLPLLFTRPGELRGMLWTEVAGDTWTIPGARTKMRRDLIVPLAPEAQAILDELRPLTGHGLHVFASLRTLTDGRRPLSDMTLLAALRRLGYGPETATPHGFRASARTILVEVLGERADLVELQLGHKVAGPLGRAYDRAEFLAERRAMITRWAAWCSE